MPLELVRAGTVEELLEAGRRVVKTSRAPVLVLHHDGEWFALDNRCPHMGFPLHTGDVHDGLLDCHWHHARFDVSCGQTLDPWADDVDSYRVVVQDGVVWVDPNRPQRDPRAHGLERLARGLSDSLRLVIAKSVVELIEAGVPALEPVAAAALYGARERAGGWNVGLSILSAMGNALDALRPVDRQRALVHAIGRVASDCAGQPPRRPLPPLEGTGRDRAGLRAWFRETVEVRDARGGERVLAALAREHGATAALDAALAAATDHRYADVGHALDYAVKCAELAERVGDEVGPDGVALLFTSLVPQLVQVERMEETSAWRRPVDVAVLVADAAREIPPAPFAVAQLEDEPLVEEEQLAERMLGEDPAGVVTELVERLRDGASPVALADAVVTAACLRVLRFGTANEVADWDVVHHTLTYANAVAEGMRRAPSPELFRAVLDGAMSVYLDRFLNVPAAALPRDDGGEAELAALPAMYDGRAPVEAAAGLSWRFLARGGDPWELLAALGSVVLREDAGFHELQALEIAWRRLSRRGSCRSSHLMLVACARWVAAQYPTRRAREQTFDIARRLHRGEALFED